MTEFERHPPPRHSAAVLSWLLHDDWDTPAGDFEEYFHQMVKAHGTVWARRWYRRQVLSLLPGRLAEKSIWGLFMLVSNLKVAIRSLKRHPWISAMNVTGLAVGIAACLLIGLYVADELTFDGMHSKSGRIVRVIETVTTAEGDEQRFAYTTGALGPAMVRELPEVHESVRMLSSFTIGRQTVSHNDARFYEGAYLFVDSTFFDLFDFGFVSGDRETALDAPNSLVLTESSARRYFGDKDPMGETLSVERMGDFTVTGVVQDPPADTHLDFSMLGSLSTFTRNRGFRERIADWGTSSFRTYMLLDEKASVEDVQARMEALVARNASAEARDRRRVDLQPMRDIHFGSADIDFDENRGRASRSTISILSLVGLFILVIACINFTNMAIASSMRRAREVGLRKAVGAHRTQLVRQFLGESMVTSGAAFVLALAVAGVALGPFNGLTGRSLSMNPIEHPFLALALLVAVIVVGILSGSYPAFFLARFAPAVVLKGSASSRDGRVGKVLVVAQFAMTTGLLIATTVLARQIDFLRTTPLGFNEERLVVIDINDSNPRANFRAMKRELAADGSVGSLSVSSNVPGDWKSISQVEIAPAVRPDDGLVTSWFLGVDSDFLATFEIHLVEGRNFSDAPSADSLSVLLSMTAAERLGVGLGDRVSIPGSSLMDRYAQSAFEPTVIGIVDDFHFRSLREEMEPMVLAFHANPVDVIDYFTARIDGQDVQRTMAHLRAVGERFDPGHPFEFNFLEDRIGDFYVEENRLGRIFGVATGLSVVIACLGLLGLAALATSRRTKELGVRRTLGAGVPGLVLLLSADIVKLVAIAFVIAAPIAWVAMDQWLESFAFRVNVGVGTVLLAGAASLAFAVATVGWQSFRAAAADPVTSLRHE